MINEDRPRAAPGWLLDPARLVSRGKTDLCIMSAETAGRLHRLRNRQFDLIARLAEISLSIERAIHEEPYNGPERNTQGN